MILAGHYVCIAVAASARGCLLKAEISVEPSAIMTLGFYFKDCAMCGSFFKISKSHGHLSWQRALRVLCLRRIH